MSAAIDVTPSGEPVSTRDQPKPKDVYVVTRVARTALRHVRARHFRRIYAFAIA